MMFSSTLQEQLYWEGERRCSIITSRGIIAIIERDIKKMSRYKFFLAMRTISFIVHVLIFGVTASAIVNYPYFYKFYLLGVYSSILFSMSTYMGYDVIDEAQDGLFDYYLSLPISRRELIIGKTIGSGLTALSYSLPMLIIISLLIGINSPDRVLLAVFSASLFALGVSGFMISITLAIKSADIADIAFGVVSTLLIRLSTIYYPLAVMPTYYRVLAELNPITHLADFLRFVILGEGYSIPPEGSLIALIGLAAGSISVAVILIEKAIEGGRWR